MRDVTAWERWCVRVLGEKWFEDVGKTAIAFAGFMGLLCGAAFIACGAWVRGILTLSVTGVAAWGLWKIR